MKSLKIIIVIILLLMLIPGFLFLTSEKDDEVLADSLNSDNEIPISKTIKSILDDYLKDQGFSQYQVYYQEELSHDYYIAGIKLESGRFLNYQYYLIDNTELTVNEIGAFDLLIDYIDDQYPKIIFESKHINSVTPFRYPKKKYTYNIETKEIKASPWIYTIGKEYTPIAVGNGHNKTTLEEISVKDSSLQFHFNQHKDSILAGGLFTPNIEVVSIKEKSLTLGLENVYYTESIIDTFEKNNNILSLEVDEGRKINGKNQTILSIRLSKDIQYFYLELKANENGYMDLVIELLETKE